MISSILPSTHLALISGEVPRLINFIIFALALYFLLRKPTAAFLRQRADRIRHELDQARTERETARAKLHSIESRLNSLDDEIRQLRAQASAEADAEEARIAASAEAEAEKLQALARREIESAANAARLELKAFAAQQAVNLVRVILRRELNEQDHHRLIERFGEQIREVRR